MKIAEPRIAYSGRSVQMAGSKRMTANVAHEVRIVKYGKSRNSAAAQDRSQSHARHDSMRSMRKSEVQDLTS